jgi:hypothetical protein
MNRCISRVFFFFITLKKKLSKYHKPKTFKFVNHNKYKDIENWLRDQLLLYSPFKIQKLPN